MCEATGLARHELIDLHSGRDYKVFSVGASPGFPFLGVLDERLRMPRHPTPRALVPAHAVAMTGLQTGIYPVAGPGGWQLLGYALRAVYDPWREQPFLIALGDTVRFEPEDGEVPPDPLARPLLPVEPERPVLRVDEPGLLDLVVDGGRHMGGRFGMAQSGPVDARAARLANALVGNDALEPVLELTVRGPSLTALRAGAHRDRGAGVPALDRRPAGRGADDARARRGRPPLVPAHRTGRALVPRDRGRHRERALHGQREHRRARPGRARAGGRRRAWHRARGRLGDAHERARRLAGQRRDGAHPARPAGLARGARAARRRRAAHCGRRSHRRAARGRVDPGRRVRERAAAARGRADHAQRRPVRPARRPLPHGRLREAGGRAPRRSADHRPAAPGHARALQAGRARAALGSRSSRRAILARCAARLSRTRSRGPAASACCWRSRSSRCWCRSSAATGGIATSSTSSPPDGISRSATSTSRC